MTIIDEMLACCKTMNALAREFNEYATDNFKDEIERGLLLTECITLKEKVHSIRRHIEAMPHT